MYFWAMTPIPHRYFDKLRNVISEFEQWIASTEAAEDGSIKLEDLKVAFVRATNIYTKTLELYRIGSDTPGKTPPPDEGSEVTKLSPG